MSTRVLLLGFALALPAQLAAQSAELRARVDAQTLALVSPLLENAVRDSLPVRALESKILEGVTKGVPAERIGGVVAQLANEFRSARSALREGLPSAAIHPGEIVAVATAARLGVGAEVSRELWTSRRGAVSLEVPITVLGELVRRGVPVTQAADVMAHIVSSSVPLPVAAQIPGKIDGAVGAGTSPGAALGEALRALHIPDPPGQAVGRGQGRGRGPGG